MSLDLLKIKITQHASKRLCERFSMSTDYAINYLHTALENAHYIGTQKDLSHVFTHKNTVVILDKNCKKVITVMIKNKNWRKKIKKILGGVNK